MFYFLYRDVIVSYSIIDFRRLSIIPLESLISGMHNRIVSNTSVNIPRKMEEQLHPVAAIGGYRYSTGVVYVGSWSSNGKRQGEGHLLLPNGTRYDGCFEDGTFNGLGVLSFADGSKYEGEFFQGWFHGYGSFWRADGMRHEGEFRGGKIWGFGMTTFSDNTNGFPKNEGYFESGQLKKRKRCPDMVQKAQKIAFMARNKYLDN